MYGDPIFASKCSKYRCSHSSLVHYCSIFPYMPPGGEGAGPGGIVTGAGVRGIIGAVTRSVYLFLSVIDL